MKYVLGAVGALAIVGGVIVYKTVLSRFGNIIAFRVDRDFIVIARYPFDPSFLEYSKDMEASMQAIYDEHLDHLETEELNNLFYEG